MNRHTLVLRLSRRAIGGVVLSEDRLILCDGRHLSSARARMVTAGDRYLRRLFDLTQPREVLVDAPSKEGSSTAALLDAVRTLAAERDVPVRQLAYREILSTYGLPGGLISRTELRRVIETFWQDLPTAIGGTRPFVLEAAAVALFHQTSQALAPDPT